MRNAKKRVVDLVSDEFDYIQKQERTNLELVDVEFVKEGKNRFLRVYIDKEGGVSLDDCEQISRALNNRLDKLDPIEEAYMLEVSSAGIERPLKKLEDFERFKGKLVQIKLYFPINSTKIIEGESLGVINEEINVKDLNSQEVIKLTIDKVASAKILFRF